LNSYHVQRFLVGCEITTTTTTKSFSPKQVEVG
jgi:hypothetical protein